MGAEQFEKQNADGEDVGAQLVAQLAFLREVDKLKSISRRTSLIDGSRRENSAEHSWHIALAAIVLVEHSNIAVDLLRVIKLLLMHDIVEIDAGDTFAFDMTAKESQAERENAAAARLFGMLPSEQRDEFLSLWEEFEAGETPEAKFAVALDRLMPVFQNFANQGGTWRAAALHRGQVNKRLSPIGDGSAAVWAYVEKILDEAQVLDYIAPEP